MLTDPRMNSDDVTPWCGLFLTCRGKIYIQDHTTTNKDSIYVWSPNANSSLLGVVAISARCKTHSTMVPC
jgi:hypothetical protein